jgi:hypothetical protein
MCDNKGLLTWIEQAIEWTYMMPNVTLQAEWGTESVILTTYKELNMNFAFLRVKSHQDNDTLEINLSLESCLNVEADQLATEYKQEDQMR